jgi:hypothetical protein
MGFAMSGTALALAATGRRRRRTGVLSGLIGAATLEAAFGYCLACKMFPLLIRAGLVPAEACASCANIWDRPAAPEAQPPRWVTAVSTPSTAMSAFVWSGRLLRLGDLRQVGQAALRHGAVPVDLAAVTLPSSYSSAQQGRTR